MPNGSNGVVLGTAVVDGVVAKIVSERNRKQILMEFLHGHALTVYKSVTF